MPVTTEEITSPVRLERARAVLRSGGWVLLTDHTRTTKGVTLPLFVAQRREQNLSTTVIRATTLSELIRRCWVHEDRVERKP